MIWAMTTMFIDLIFLIIFLLKLHVYTRIHLEGSETVIWDKSLG